jgi:hypothetical protein
LADPVLLLFVNRFHDIAGVGQVVEAYFAGNYQRAVARMAIRLTERLAARDPAFRPRLHYDRRISFAPDSQPILTVVVGYRGIHYRLFPWRRLHRTAMLRQLRRDRLVFSSPDRVRWVFDRRLAPSVGELAARVRRAFPGGRLPRGNAPLLSDRQIVLL